MCLYIYIYGGLDTIKSKSKMMPINHIPMSTIIALDAYSTWKFCLKAEIWQSANLIIQWNGEEAWPSL